MKILLIQPAKAPSTIGGEDVYMFEPLALEYVAAGVADDHDVKILDMRIEKDLKGFLMTIFILKDFSACVIGYGSP